MSVAVSEGDIEIKLDGQVEVLKSSLRAAKRVNSAGGFTHVVNRIQATDFEFFVLVIAAGLNKTTQEVEDKVYKSGMPQLARPIVQFVNLLANGGKPFIREEEAPTPSAGEE